MIQVPCWTLDAPNLSFATLLSDQIALNPSTFNQPWHLLYAAMLLLYGTVTRGRRRTPRLLLKQSLTLNKMEIASYQQSNAELSSPAQHSGRWGRPLGVLLISYRIGCEEANCTVVTPKTLQQTWLTGRCSAALTLPPQHHLPLNEARTL